jgi:GNAT superfamily N-acetyltransferase
VPCDVRPAEVPDGAALADLYRRSSLSNVGDQPHLLEHPDALAFPWSEGVQARTRVATRDRQIVGFATLESTNAVTELEHLFVDPDSMRQGVASALIRDAVVVARAYGARRLVVTANPHALAFYLRVGFFEDGATTTRFGPAQRMHMNFGA